MEQGERIGPLVPRGGGDTVTWMPNL
jgi:hypothetical protein